MRVWERATGIRATVCPIFNWPRSHFTPVEKREMTYNDAVMLEHQPASRSPQSYPFISTFWWSGMNWKREKLSPTSQIKLRKFIWWEMHLVTDTQDAMHRQKRGIKLRHDHVGGLRIGPKTKEEGYAVQEWDVVGGRKGDARRVWAMGRGFRRGLKCLDLAENDFATFWLCHQTLLAPWHS